MLSNGFDAPLHLKLKASKTLVYFQLAIHGLALGAMLIPSSLPWYIRIMISALLCINIGYVVVRFIRQKMLAMSLHWNKNSGWKEEELMWTTQQRLIVTPWFVLFKLINDDNSKPVLIFYDQCEDRNSFRRLRVLLECLSDSTDEKHRFS